MSSCTHVPSKMDNGSVCVYINVDMFFCYFVLWFFAVSLWIFKGIWVIEMFVSVCQQWCILQISRIQWPIWIHCIGSVWVFVSCLKSVLFSTQLEMSYSQSCVWFLACNEYGLDSLKMFKGFFFLCFNKVVMINIFVKWWQGLEQFVGLFLAFFVISVQVVPDSQGL